MLNDLLYIFIGMLIYPLLLVLAFLWHVTRVAIHDAIGRKRKIRTFINSWKQTFFYELRGMHRDI